jgi:hypothetical protein
MATGYWKVNVVNGNFELQDFTPISSTRVSLVVKLTIPGASAEETLSGITGSTGDYDPANPHSFPLKIEPADVTAETGSTFRDGVYRFNVTFQISGVTYTFDQRILHLPVIDAAISTKLDAYLKDLCDKCNNTEKLRTLQELVVLRQGAQLDINAARYTAAAEKVTLMSNISTGASCTCICGCV